MGKRIARLVARVEKLATGRCPRCGGSGIVTKASYHSIRQVPCKVCR